MEIRKASFAELVLIEDLVRQTIKAIYPLYYPKGAVEFFLALHCKENIATDIEAQNLYVLDSNGAIVGTVTIKNEAMYRLFVLPEHQGNGYGRTLLDFSEKLIAKNYQKIRIDASLPAKMIYLKRGYKEKEFHSLLTDNGDYLCYDVMEKSTTRTESL